MHHTKTENLIKKKELFRVKATTYITGGVKNSFINDLLKRGDMEAQLLKKIIALHYKICKANNITSNHDFDAIEAMLCKT